MPQRLEFCKERKQKLIDLSEMGMGDPVSTDSLGGIDTRIATFADPFMAFL